MLALRLQGKFGGNTAGTGLLSLHDLFNQASQDMKN